MTKHTRAARHLIGLGYPPHLAIRVAKTPPFAVMPINGPEGLERPGRDLRAAVDRQMPTVVSLILEAAVRP